MASQDWWWQQSTTTQRWGHLGPQSQNTGCLAAAVYPDTYNIIHMIDNSKQSVNFIREVNFMKVSIGTSLTNSVLIEKNAMLLVEANSGKGTGRKAQKHALHISVQLWIVIGIEPL